MYGAEATAVIVKWREARDEFAAAAELVGGADSAAVARLRHQGEVHVVVGDDQRQPRVVHAGFFVPLDTGYGSTLVFGEGDLLLNNMAWALRHFPVFPVFGRGDYPVQPIYAGDLAAQAVEAGSRIGNFIADAAGPETFSFEELLRLLASAVGARVRLAHTPTSLGFGLTRLVGLLLRDVVLSRDEVDGLMAELLTSGGTPTGTTRLADWLDDNSDGLGRRYVSERRRN